MPAHGLVHIFYDGAARVVGAMRDAGRGMAAFQRHVYPAFAVAVEGHVQLVEQHALHGTAAIFGKETHGHIVVEMVAGHEHIVLKGLLVLRVGGEDNAALSHGGVAAVQPFGRHEQMDLEALVGKGEGRRTAGKAGTDDKDLGTDTQIIHSTPALRGYRGRVRSL